MKWINVKEEMPGPNDNIVAYTPGNGNHVITYRHMFGGSLSRCRLATHWLALEPPNNTVKDRQVYNCKKYGRCHDLTAVGCNEKCRSYAPAT